MGTPSSASIIQDVDLALKVLENFNRANGAALEGLDGRNIKFQLGRCTDQR